jgi:predicted membrane channel-forming protein YqfA (hemolysin III family)
VITEPTTTITDYVLGGVLLAWGRIVWRQARIDEVSAGRWWAIGFFAIALAALTGGTVHGFRGPLGPGWEAVLWKASLFGIGGFAFAAVMTAIAGGANRRWRPLLASIAVVALVGYVAWLAGHPEFRYASTASAVGLAWLLAQQAIGWIHNRIPSAPWIATGVVAAAVGAVIQQAGLAPHPRFNHNDVFHVIQMGSSYLFYRGGLLLTDRNGVRVA